MRFIGDLHIHSRFSRATSRVITPEVLSFWAGIKGISVIATGDFTHPAWFSELQEKLIEAEEGLYRIRPELIGTANTRFPQSCSLDPRFLISGEISCIYKKNGKTRKLHHLILMPDMMSARKFNDRLGQVGNICSDGRPILGLDSRDLLEITLEVSDRALFIPAHIWTPWFSLFGSKSGFDSIEECFEDLTGHIYALETGLSSDPPMNRLISALDQYLLVSNSDAHSPGKLGREANVFDTDLSYHSITQAMIHGEGFTGTLEFYPEEGKYHLDGHRKCQVRLQPYETLECKGTCPVCGRPLTEGVLNRIYQLADRKNPELSKEFFSLIPLTEILSELFDCGPSTKKVTELYDKLITELGPELHILMDVSLDDLNIVGGTVLAEAIGRMRSGEVIRQAGYDGEYGNIRLFHDMEREAVLGQMGLFGRPERKKRVKSHCSKIPVKRAEGEKKGINGSSNVNVSYPVPDALNPEQKAAVLYKGGHLLVVAGPGTGKTMTLTHRIAYLIMQGIAEPEQILALTFTRKAANEMKERIGRLLNIKARNGVIVYTFHKLCLDVLRTEGHRLSLAADFSVCSEEDRNRVLEQAISAYGGTRVSRSVFKKALPKLKLFQLSGNTENTFSEALTDLFEKYTRMLRDFCMLDLDDVEVECLKLFRKYPEVARSYRKKFPWIFVDEYQDTNPTQVEILKELVGHEDQCRICAIGDPDQAIYGFRGADVSNFYRFAIDFQGARTLTLAENYRSTDFILKSASALMGRKRSLESKRQGESPIFLAHCRTDAEEAEMVVEQVERLIGGTSYFSLDSGRVSSDEGEETLGFGDIGVLFRLNAQGDALQEAFDRAGIPVVRSGEASLVSRYPVNILWRFFQALSKPGNTFYNRMYQLALEEGNIVEKKPGHVLDLEDYLPNIIDDALLIHGLNKLSDEELEIVGRIKRMASDFTGDMNGFLDVLSLERGIDHSFLLGDRVALMSIHAAKGLEWPVVFITGCENQLLPCSLFNDTDEEEERRLFYVGITRAQSRLILSYAARRSLNSRSLNLEPSPFLNTLPQGLTAFVERGRLTLRPPKQKQLELF